MLTLQPIEQPVDNLVQAVARTSGDVRPFPEWTGANMPSSDNPQAVAVPVSAVTPVPVLTPSPIGQLTPVLWAGQ